MESINELEKEIENFKKNMSVSGEVCRNLSNISELIKNQTVSLNEISNDIISKFSEMPESVKKINEAVISRTVANIAVENSKYIEYLEKYKHKIDELENRVELNKRHIDKSIDDTIEKMESIPKIISRDCQMSNAELTVVIEEMIQEKINIVLDNSKSVSENFVKCSDLFTETKGKIEDSIGLMQKIQNEFKSSGDLYIKEISEYTDDIDRIISKNNLDLTESLNKYVDEINSNLDKNNDENIIAIDNLKEDLNAKSNELGSKIESINNIISSLKEKSEDNSVSITDIKNKIDNVIISNNDIKESISSISEKNIEEYKDISETLKTDLINKNDELNYKVEDIGNVISSIDEKVLSNSTFIMEVKNEINNVNHLKDDIKESFGNIFEEINLIEKDIEKFDLKILSETKNIDAAIVNLVNKSDDNKNENLNMLFDIKKSNEKENAIIGEKVDKKTNNLEGVLNQNKKQILNKVSESESKITKKIDEMNKILIGKINKIDIESVKKQNENLEHLFSVRTTIMLIISGLAVILAILGFVF